MFCIRCLPLACIVLGCVTFSGESVADDEAKPAAVADDALRTELLRRNQTDQEVRQRLIEIANSSGTELGGSAITDPGVLRIAAEMTRIDAENREWLRQVIDSRGWPLKSQIGAEAADAAFLIAQHAAADPGFQKRCLKLMQAAPKDEVRLPNVALLTDRVRLADGKQQLYGSQVELRDGQWVMRPTEDPEKVDQRRAEMGLPPMAEYLQQIQKVYGQPQPESDRTAP